MGYKQRPSDDLEGYGRGDIAKELRFKTKDGTLVDVTYDDLAADVNFVCDPLALGKGNRDQDALIGYETYDSGRDTEHDVMNLNLQVYPYCEDKFIVEQVARDFLIHIFPLMLGSLSKIFGLFLLCLSPTGSRPVSVMQQLNQLIQEAVRALLHECGIREQQR